MTSSSAYSGMVQSDGAWPRYQSRAPFVSANEGLAGGQDAWLASRNACGAVDAWRSPSRSHRGRAFKEHTTISSERCLETYLVEINEIPLLTAAEERALGRR